MLGIFLDTASINRGDLDLSKLSNSLESWQFLDITSLEDDPGIISEATVIVSNKVVLDQSTLVNAPNVKLICIAATGVNNVDIKFARQQGITICNVPFYATNSVVQHVFTLILALTTKLPQYQSALAAGRWQQSQHFCLLDYPIRELSGLTLGIIGYGILGKAVAISAKAFGLHVIVAERVGNKLRPGRVEINQLLRQADIVSLHCPLTKQTRSLIAEAQLVSMKSDALLINTARGGLVDEVALLSALKQGRIAGAGVDVLQQEPPQANCALLEANLPNLIVTPHIAWASRESRQRLINSVADNIYAYKDGKPVNIVS
jgi:glycerate dehydrogenase